MKVPRLWTALLATLLLAMPAAAAVPSDAVRAQAERLVALFNDEARPEEMFSDPFLAQVPPARMDALVAQVRAQSGRALAVDRIEAESPFAGTVYLDFERATLELALAVAPEPPHAITGLLIRGSEVRGDSIEAVLADLRALPGTTSFAIGRLGESDPAFVHALDHDRPMAIGSAFKLFILAELARQIEAGERRWSDVVALDRRSLPSGILQDWPAGSPLTLHTLAALMISKSDNTATDILLHTLGREKVEALLPALGLADPARNRPFLSTYEAFVLKAAKDAAPAEAYAAADEAGRRAMLARIAGTPPEALDMARFAGTPNAIATVEWFASAADLVRTMDWLRRHGGEEALEILAINPGLGPSLARRFDYLGYKGGSETGVINMTFLVRTQGGAWKALSASWNNPEAAIDDAAFVSIVSRAVTLLADRP